MIPPTFERLYCRRPIFGPLPVALIDRFDALRSAKAAREGDGLLISMLNISMLVKSCLTRRIP
jgi:hypothetical protein